MTEHTAVIHGRDRRTNDGNDNGAMMRRAVTTRTQPLSSPPHRRTLDAERRELEPLAGVSGRVASGSLVAGHQPHGHRYGRLSAGRNA